MDSKHIDLYGTLTPNVVKVLLILEELNLPFEQHTINIKTGDQYTEEFKKINPNSKIPALVDHSAPGKPLVVFESGNILFYLATKYGNGKFLPNPTTDIHGYTETLNWLFWQMAGFGPNFGQYFHFTFYANEKIDYSITRFTNELRRLIYVLENQLKNQNFVAGNEYSIADMSIYPWLKLIKNRDEFTATEFPRVHQYLDRVRAIPSVNKVLNKVEEELAKNPLKKPSDEERKIMFNVDGRDKQTVSN